jgi:hypothetical protein
MKTTKRHQLEMMFTALLFGVLGASVGYYIGAAEAAAKVLAAGR